MPSQGERWRESEAELFRLLVENVKDYAIFVIDPLGRVQTWNLAAERLLGYSEAEIIGQPAAIFFTPEDIQDDIPTKEMQAAVSTGAGNDDRWHVRKDGSRFWSSGITTPLRDSDGNVLGFAKIMRDRTSLKLQAEQDRLESQLLDAVGQAVIATEADGTVLYWNRYAETLYGWSRAEAVGRKIAELTVPHLQQTHSAAIMDAVNSGATWSGKFQVLRRDGSSFMAQVTNAPLLDAAGQVRAVIGVSFDISEREAAQQQLREQAQLTRTITDNAATAIFMMDDQSRCTFVNPAAEKMVGFTFQELKGGVLHNFIHHHRPDGRPYPVQECPIDRALPEHFDVVSHEDVFIRKSGEFFPVLCNAKPIRRDGKAIGTVVEVQDLTEQKRSEAAARQRSEQVRRLAEVATRINVATDVRSVLGVVTEEARQLIGAHQSVTSMTTGRDWSQAINSVSLSEKYADWRGYDAVPDGSGIYSRVCQTNRPMRLTQAELQSHMAWKAFGHESARHPPMQGWLAAPLLGRDGRNLGLIQLSDKHEGDFNEDDEAVLVQLAQMASVAIENARLVEDLRQSDRRKDEFLATLAHELRNPLAPLRNALQVLNLSRVDAATAQQVRDMMDRQVDQLVRLVDDLLDISRVMRSKIELRKETVELASVVARAVETAQPLIDVQGHTLELSLPPESLLLDVDPVRMAQVVGNLLTNAAKYTDAGGRIWITAERRGDEVLTRVRDNGIGIAPDMLPHVFELFVQADHSSAKAQGGLGIGLTLVKNLVEMHGGTITAHSEGLGRGSEFVLRLPLVVRESESSTVHRTDDLEQPPADSGVRVLVVDDNQDAARSLALLLRLQGHHVQVAHDGQAALELAAAQRPQLVFLDIGMPKMDGYEVARRMRQLPGLQSVVLAALTGWGQAEDRRRTADAGFDHHLVKPPEPQLLETVLTSLRNASS